MKRIFTTLLTLSLLLSLAACGNTSAKETLPEVMVPASEPAMETVSETKEVPEAAPYYGTWEVKDFQWAYISALTPEERDALIGTTVTYQEDTVNTEGNTIGPVTYEMDDEPIEETDVADDYRANLGEWWNGISQVTGVSVNYTDVFFGHRFFVVDSDTIWIFYEGVFFLAKRV